ncbi:MAG: hypothetical protein JW821_01090 [Deltaproteobacteria bacterium]|nr:hypothetical protein [Deltaproteobacteria bacterium]
MGPFSGRHLFLVGVGLLYAVLFLIRPEEALTALRSSGRILGILFVPLGLIFLLMFALRFFLDPSRVARFLGEEAGLRGDLFSIAAGILSFGPIYAWYPLLRDMKQRGAGNRILALFLGNRAVKPFLLPLMISYFGWSYVILFTLFMILGSIGVAYLTDLFCGIDKG